MNILTNSEQAFVPVIQPAHFPTFYLIPETSTIPQQRPASNDPAYHPPALTKLKPPQETQIQRFIRIEKEIFQEACTDLLGFFSHILYSLGSVSRPSPCRLPPARWEVYG